MFNRKNLLENEYFPAELPPCFSSSSLSDNADTIIRATGSVNVKYSVPLTYSGYKSESARRRFALPNPYHYCKIVDFVVTHEKEIKTILQRSKYSLTAPIDKTPSNKEPYSKKTSSISETKKEIEKAFQDNRYEIRLDISSFFDSIYTHTIPWAIHGIETAKKHTKDSSLWGNQLDKLVEALNYNQTNGILIGNAISRIVSEIILCSVDAQIQKDLPSITCRRYVDDYYIYTKDSSQIQEIIAKVRVALAQYQLSINESKISIKESPFIYGKPWIDQVRLFMFLSPDVYLSRLITEFNDHKDISILRYGLRILSTYKFTKQEWPTIQSRILNLLVRFPSLSDRILPILLQNKDFLGKTLLKNALYRIIDNSILLGHSLELIWAVWFLKVFEIRVSQEYGRRVLGSENDLAIVIMMDIMFAQGLAEGEVILKQRKTIRDMLLEANETDETTTNQLMWSKHWLLAYESERLGWMDFPGEPFRIVCKDQFFRAMQKNGIKFYDEDYHYSELEKPSRSKYSLVTHDELRCALHRIKESVLKNVSKGQDNSVDEDQLVYEFISALESEQQTYTVF